MGFDGGPDTAFHVQYRAPVTRPPGEARPDVEVVFELADRLGFADQFWSAGLGRAFDARLAPHGLQLRDLIEEPRGITVPAEVQYRKYADHEAGHGVRGFATPTGKLELYSEKLAVHGYAPLPIYEPPRTSPVENAGLRADYPLVLSSRKLTCIVHSQHRGIPSLRKRWPDAFVELHPRTAAAWGVHDGQLLRVETQMAGITVKAVLDDRILEGAVVGQAGWWEDCPELNLPGYEPFSDEGANYNRLIATDIVDAVSGGVPLKSYYCRIRPLD